ncbi:MAG: hypothetical protein KDD82_03620 [Planctomycetes bacterium]|nr:hypothetical protein [Planctomycetota bacterium]
MSASDPSPPASPSARWEAHVARRTDALWVRVLLWVVGVSFVSTLIGMLALFVLGV